MSKFEKEKIRELRKQLKMSQEDFARFLGVTYQTLSRWERGVFKPSKLAIEKLEKVLKESEHGKS